MLATTQPASCQVLIDESLPEWDTSAEILKALAGKKGLPEELEGMEDEEDMDEEGDGSSAEGEWTRHRP